ncbi:enoyl-CoA hydratase/isomerase [Ensifer sp. T173]|uniref:Enoyl-CoA hydratase/isomerase n=1 Tax=Ensifer canadensis TaxID=555315 RepID=A0AAW4FRY8_9HYPH|nr:enoyl-CoA hydratase/isomerase [Ensifer canadensis]MBM3094035.1 enoyl-CoA hydratase/isomerase [Ensifer canadensis]UBI81055.1 enoyl-CoA hydratase/isomerase [Ensifer canadensis]
MTEIYRNLRVRFEDDLCFVQIYRPDTNNAIDEHLVIEIIDVLDQCETAVKILVLEGLPEAFCLGADFKQLQFGDTPTPQDPGPLYDLWYRLATGPYVTIAHVRGRVNAGGVGFVAACDVVLSDDKASFSLSELLFGLMPACVFPFLVRRIGFARAHYLTLMTQPVTAQRALEWGLVDACEEDSANLLRKHLLRLRRLSKDAVARYKRYAVALDDKLMTSRMPAIAANVEVFGNSDNLKNIERFVDTGRFPWEAA